jgi:hypothetical protein
MALPPRGERLPSEMNEGTDYSYKGHKGPKYGLGALGLLGPSPSAQFYADRWPDRQPRWSKVIAVGYMPFGCNYFPILCHYRVLEITLLSSQMSRNNDWQYTRVCGTCNRALRHLLLVCVQTATVIHSVRLLFTEVQIKMADCICWFP